MSVELCGLGFLEQGDDQPNCLRERERERVIGGGMNWGQKDRYGYLQ